MTAERPPTLAEARAAVAAWRHRTFGDKEDIRGLVLKLVEEALELADRPDSEEEMADVAIVLFAIVEKQEVHLPSAIMDKLAVLRARSWAPPDENGVIRHMPQERER